MHNHQNSKDQNSKYKKFDLEERTFVFANNCKEFTKKLPKSVQNYEYIKQLVRSSGSQAANYIEANEALSKKDFVHRIKICRKEVKETILWLRLVDLKGRGDLKIILDGLLDEGLQLKKIFSAIVEKSK